MKIYSIKRKLRSKGYDKYLFLAPKIQKISVIAVLYTLSMIGQKTNLRQIRQKMRN